MPKIFITLILGFMFTAASAQQNSPIEPSYTGELTDSTIIESLPLVSRYYFVHQYLSVVAASIKTDQGDIFGSPFLLNTYGSILNEFRTPYKDSDIAVEKIADGDNTVYVWRLPEPQKSREALYVAFFPVDGVYKAYAISIGKYVDWEVSSSTKSSRSTFGRIKKPSSAQECFELLKKRGAYTGTITPGQFIQPGYTCPF